MRIRFFRIRAGLRQADVAKKLDIDQTAVSNWELGKSKPLRKYHKKLAKLFGCTVEELFSAEE